ncbi:MAG TPA: adenosylmethionine decarboxylase [Fimbriimonas sp.]|nr:adenosylmethionine decarboxylase [Fimbriimonas sp.]
MALTGFRSRLGFLGRLFQASDRSSSAVAEAPRIVNDGGWTTIYCDNIEAFSEWIDQDEQGIPPRVGEEPSLGSHLLIELYGCNEEALRTEQCVGTAMREAAVESKATVVEQSFHEFKPYGVSGAVIIQESHYTIHTWPEHKYAAVDLFYCGGTVLVHRAIDVLNERFQPERIKFLIVRRGLQSEVEQP